MLTLATTATDAAMARRRNGGFGLDASRAVLGHAARTAVSAGRCRHHGVRGARAIFRTQVAMMHDMMRNMLVVAYVAMMVRPR